MAHLLHAMRLVGVDHVGIGLDWDGGGGVTGMEDVAGIPEITKRLLAAGYSEAGSRENLGRQYPARDAESSKRKAIAGHERKRHSET